MAACYCASTRGNYTLFTNQKTNTKFNGKYLALPQEYRVYIDLHKFKERYELDLPVMSAHNLIIGRTYVDIGDTLTVRKVAYKDGVK